MIQEKILMTATKMTGKSQDPSHLVSTFLDKIMPHLAHVSMISGRMFNLKTRTSQSQLNSHVPINVAITAEDVGTTHSSTIWQHGNQVMIIRDSKAL
jgi:hypothetical protein